MIASIKRKKTAAKAAWVGKRLRPFENTGKSGGMYEREKEAVRGVTVAVPERRVAVLSERLRRERAGRGTGWRERRRGRDCDGRKRRRGHGYRTFRDGRTGQRNTDRRRKRQNLQGDSLRGGACRRTALEVAATCGKLGGRPGVYGILRRRRTAGTGAFPDVDGRVYH